MTNEQTAAVGELVSATWHINNTMDDARTWDALDQVREAFGWLVRQQPTKGHIPQQIPCGETICAHSRNPIDCWECRIIREYLNQQIPEQPPLPFPEPEEKAGETICAHSNNPFYCPVCKQYRGILRGAL